MLNGGIFGFYLSWWNHSPYKWNKNRLKPRAEVLGRQVLWNGTEHSFKLAHIKIFCDLTLSQTSKMMMARDNDVPSTQWSRDCISVPEYLANNKNVNDSLLYLISEPDELCILNISLFQVGQNISQIISIMQKLYPCDTTMDEREKIF